MVRARFCAVVGDVARVVGSGACRRRRRYCARVPPPSSSLSILRVPSSSSSSVLRARLVVIVVDIARTCHRHRLRCRYCARRRRCVVANTARASSSSSLILRALFFRRSSLALTAAQRLSFDMPMGESHSLGAIAWRGADAHDAYRGACGPAIRRRRGRARNFDDEDDTRAQYRRRRRRARAIDDDDTRAQYRRLPWLATAAPWSEAVARRRGRTDRPPTHQGRPPEELTDRRRGLRRGFGIHAYAETTRSEPMCLRAAGQGGGANPGAAPARRRRRR